MNIKKHILIITTIITASSCTTDSVSDLINLPEVEDITYTNTVKAIIDANCIVCHGTSPTNGAPMSLTTYENVKNAVLNRGLIDRISRAEGTSGAMPLGGPRLPQLEINQIIQWDDEGLLE